MFKSSKASDISCLSDTDLHSSINETPNGIPRSFVQPKITSTPLHQVLKKDNIYSTPVKTRLSSPKRYSLSEIATPPRSNRLENGKSSLIQNSSGPLLASMKYSANVSTYEDTKSPGLARRIIQYNEEAQKERQRQSTHQEKYGSPGLFPIVHLFKKQLPMLEQKPRRVTIKISSPEYSRFHSPEYNRKLLEGIVRPNSVSRSKLFPQGGNEAGTRSVLDALKEISRKRIHANEEFDLIEDGGKRLKTDQVNGETNKRLREISPQLDSPSSPSTPVSKRLCAYDEYAASRSSMDFSFAKKTEPTGSKRKTTSTLTEIVAEPKQVKLINAETQTIVAEKTTEEVNKTVESSEVTDNTEEHVKKKDSPVKVFDDAPLERIRKNRLAALMGTLVGKEVVLAPKPDISTVLSSDSDIEDSEPTEPQEIKIKEKDKPLISILSASKKDSPVKSDKHVRFNIPESTSSTESSVIQTSVSSTIPVVPVALDKPPDDVSDKKLETPAPPSSPVELNPAPSTTSVNSTPTFSFGSKVSTAISPVVSSVQSTTHSLSVTSNSTPLAFNFFPSTTPTKAPVVTCLPSTSIAFTPPQTTTSPSKVGGFKFDLNKPINFSTSSSAPTNIPKFSFGAATEKTTTALVTSINTPTVVSSTGQPLGNLFNTEAKTTPNFGIASSTSVPAPMFSFGAKTDTSTTKVNSFNFGSTTNSTAASAFGTNTVTSVVPAFGSHNQAPVSISSSKPAPMFNFGKGGNTTTTSANTGFPITTSAFGSNSLVSNIAQNTSSAFNPNFGSNVGQTTTSTTGVFNSPFAMTTSAIVTATATPTFATPNTTSGFSFNAGAPQFGNNVKSGMFGTNSTSTFGTTSGNAFGANNSPFNQTTAQNTFGTSAVPSFGTANAFGNTATSNAPVTSASVFGSTPTTKASGGFVPPPNIFGATQGQGSVFESNPKPLFGTATTLSFGSNATPAATTTASSFGSSNVPAFNFTAKTTANSSFPTNSGFGNVTAAGNAFGANTGFGATTTANSGFGATTTANSGFGATTTASGGFGSTTAPAFQISNSFGGAPSGFGANNSFGGGSSAFGSTTTTASSGFGTTNTPSFGQGNGSFGNGKSPVFGATANAGTGFNATSGTSGFGPQAGTGFGSSNAQFTSGFGSSSGSSAFVKPQTTSSFSTPTPAFGTPTTNSFGTQPTQNTGVFSFGSNNTQKAPTGGFSFGSNNDTPKPTFNFTGGAGNPPAFGSNTSTPFSASSTPSFGAAGPPQFNAVTGTPGVFNIGAGPSTGRARTQLRAKRRT